MIPRIQGGNPVMDPILSDSLAINFEFDIRPGELGLLSGVFFLFALNKTLA